MSKWGVLKPYFPFDPFANIYHFSKEVEDRLTNNNANFVKIIWKARYIGPKEKKKWNDPTVSPSVTLEFIKDQWTSVTTAQAQAIERIIKRDKATGTIPTWEIQSNIDFFAQEAEIFDETGEFARISVGIETCGLGDALMVTGPLRLLKEKYGDRREITIVAETEFLRLFEYNPFIDHLLTPDKFNSADFNLHFGIDNKFIQRQLNTKENAIDIFCQQLGIDGKDKSPNFFLSVGEIQKAKNQIPISKRNKLKIGIHTQSSGNSKKWARWSELVDRILEEIPNSEVFIFAKDKSLEYDGRGNIIINENIRDTAAMLNEMDYFVGVDSSLFHIAAALCIPSLVLFGRTNGQSQTQHYPYSQYIQGVCKFVEEPCWLDVPCNSKDSDFTECMFNIDSDVVFQRFKSMIEKPLISMIILTHNHLDVTKECFRSIRDNLRSYELIVVDNNSTDGTITWLKKQRTVPITKLIENSENKGVTAARNQGFKEAKGDLVWSIDNDQELGVQTLNKFLQSKADIRGGEGMRVVPVGDDSFKSVLVDDPKHATYVGCGGMMVKAEVYKLAGYLDEIFKYWCEDPEFCIRCLWRPDLRKYGFIMQLITESGITHKAHTTLGVDDKGIVRQNKKIMMQKVRQYWPPIGDKPIVSTPARIRKRGSKARILIAPDAPNLAWDVKARAYRRYLGDDFYIIVVYQNRLKQISNLNEFDLIHLFEVKQLDELPPGAKPKIIAGLTAHVWKTWGEDQMREWVKRCVALHGNSLMIVEELKQFHDKIFYTPNGVSPEFWKRKRERGKFCAGFVGKPIARKGFELIEEACRRAEVELISIRRKPIDALPPPHVLEFYQDVWVQVTASNYDCTPNPSLESASCENALLSNRIGNMPDFIEDGKNGFLVDINNEKIADPVTKVQKWGDEEVEPYVKKLLWMKDHQADVIEMGKEARKTVLENWVWEKQVRYVREMWKEVLG
jgi:ADP-heptose:LPS heptosyltransferase/glycosyltransferase involved in cell wall biosynthesis